MMKFHFKLYLLNIFWHKADAEGLTLKQRKSIFFFLTLVSSPSHVTTCNAETSVS